MTKAFRYIKQTLRLRISHDLVISRMGRLNMRNVNTLVRSLLYPGLGKSAYIIEGFTASSGSGLSVDLAMPAVAVQNIGSDDVRTVIEDNDGADVNVVLAISDPTNPRIDNIEARINIREKFTDIAADIVDPITQTILPFTVNRDKEIYLQFQKIDGTPAGSPTPPSVTAATVGVLDGSITTDVLDLSSQYLFQFTVGVEGEFLEIDLRGATPSATTRVERLAAINAAGFGTIATDVGGAIHVTASGTGEDSIVKVKAPLDAPKDCYAEVFGKTESLNYFDEYKGVNGWFKIAEVFVPATATSLTSGNIRSIEEKDTEWDADANTVEIAYSLEGHRKKTPLDHPDASIEFDHLSSAAINQLIIETSSLPTKYRGANAVLYPVSGDNQKGTVFLEDIELRDSNGDSQNASEFEQKFPVSRVDQRRDDVSGAGYAVPNNLSEAGADKLLFTPGNAVVDGTNNYTVQFFATNHNRVGIYIKNGSSVAGFTDLRVELHDSLNVQLGFTDIPIADLITVGTGWIYVDLAATLTVSSTYHYHFFLEGENGVTTPQLGEDSGGAISFREMYFPTAGKYDVATLAEVYNLLDNGGSQKIPYRNSGDDNITTPGTGFAGDGTGTNYDIIITDFSNATLWLDWVYEDYIGVDPATGRIKLPLSLDTVDSYFNEFNTKEVLAEIDAKNILRHSDQQSVEDFVEELESTKVAKSGDTMTGDLTMDADLLLLAGKTVKHNSVNVIGYMPTLSRNLDKLIIGWDYEITARDTYNFIADGAANNNVGTEFTATGNAGTLDANDTVDELEFPIYSRWLTDQIIGGVTFVEIPHNISNAYTNSRIINVCMHINLTATSMTQVSRSNFGWPEYSEYDNGDIIFTRGVATNTYNVHVLILYK